MRRILFFVILVVGLMACSPSAKQYTVGVSQCSEDIWREKQNAELRMGAYFHDNIKLCFAVAYDSDERQVQQIDSLVQAGIDLLIVAPNQVQTISPAIDRAYDKGIPVIVFERKTNSQKYTAYMGADNYEMGRTMGEYIASRLQRRGRVLEIMGLKGSSPAIERHKGFSDAMQACPDIEVVATLQGDWTEESAYLAVSEWLKNNPSAALQIDFVFGQNDRMAMGARRALQSFGAPSLRSSSASPLPRFCGIDGLTGDEGGIRLVRDSVLDATYIYPTHGDRLLQLAADILEGNPYDKEVSLKSALVTHDNANVLLLQSEEIVRQSAYLDSLYQKANGYLERLGNQRTVTLFSIGIIILLLLTAAVLYLYYRQRTRINKEREELARQQLDFYTQAAHELRTPLTLIGGPLSQLASQPELLSASEGTTSLLSIVRRNTELLTTQVNKILDVQVNGDLQGTSDKGVHGEWNESYRAARPKSASADDEQPTLLIVDDNADIRTYLRTVLSPKYLVREAADGSQGLDVAREEVPDLIISDVMMPVMNGLEFCQQVKRDFVTSHIPVILLTARALNRHQVEGYESGADAYITKPFQTDLLLARIENLLHSRRMLKNLWASTASSVRKADNPQQDVCFADKPVPLSADVSPVDPFIARFMKVLEEKMSDSDLSVENIGSDLGLSRVQLYRKVKALTGFSPVELLRKSRLARGRQLLETTDKTISEVAYEVGFTAPSYFAKCFKDEYGQSPTEMKH